MIKEYVFKYKVFTMPWWWEWKCYAESTEEACTLFRKDNPTGIECYRIAFVNPV